MNKGKIVLVQAGQMGKSRFAEMALQRYLAENPEANIVIIMRRAVESKELTNAIDEAKAMAAKIDGRITIEFFSPEITPEQVEKRMPFLRPQFHVSEMMGDNEILIHHPKEPLVLGAGLMHELRNSFPFYSLIKTRAEMKEILDRIEKREMETQWNQNYGHTLAYQMGARQGIYKVATLEDLEKEPEKPKFSALTKKRTKYRAAPLENRKQTPNKISNEKRAKNRAKRKRK